MAKQYFANKRSEWVKYCFLPREKKFISSSRRVMFFLLYRHADDGVFDDFPKISAHLPKISEAISTLFRRQDERSRTFSENFRKFPKMPEDFRRLAKTFEEDPKMFLWYTNEFKYNLRDKLDINEIIDKLTCEIMENKPLASRMYFLWILRVVYFSVKHPCLYNKQRYYTPKRLIRDLLSNDFFSQKSDFSSTNICYLYSFRAIFVL